MPVVDRAKAFENLHHCLVELRFTGIPREDGVLDGFEPCVHELFLTSEPKRGTAQKQRRLIGLLFNLSDYDRGAVGGWVRFG
ncbi:hypothetical protein NicSoilC5_23990 [Arthrobacter sp. NicSoilC5]|nr:hypothetical protein NicSoilC5_23990 [Arthrobacter sp. NicSoilC5]